MLKKVNSFLSNKNSITGASIILIITLIISNLLGVIRDHFLTQKIPTETLSTYYAAFRIPDLIFNILILGAISSAFIPIFTSYLVQKNEKEASEVASSIINIAVLTLIVLSVILVLLMPLLIPLVVPGFDSGRQLLTIKLARIMLFSPIFFGLSYILSGILNSHKRFLVYALAPLVYNLTIIVGTLLFAERYSVVGVAVAVVVGAFLHFLIQVPVVINLGFKYSFRIFWQKSGVKRIGLLMLPRSIALGTNQVMLLVFTALASSIGAYSVAIYNLADNIQTMPMVVFGTSFATAIFPSLSEKYSGKEYSEFANYIEKTFRVICFFMIPTIAGLILLRTQIVRLILGSGFFGWEQTITTANTLSFFALSLIFTGLIPLLSRAFYAMHNTRIPMITTFASAFISIVLALVFRTRFGVEGLALAYAVGSAVNFISLYILLKYKIKIFETSKMVFYLFKVVLASAIMTLGIQEIKIFIGSIVNMHRFWGIALQALIAMIVGVIIYSLMAWIFRLEEISALKLIFQKFIRRPGLNEGSSVE